MNKRFSAIAMLLCLLWSLTSADVIVYDKSVSMYDFAASEVTKYLQKAGHSVQEVPIGDLSGITDPVRIVITTLDSPEAKVFLSNSVMQKIPALSSGGFAIRIDSTGEYKAYWVLGKDEPGAMYGAFEIAELVMLYGLDCIKNMDQNPYMEKRGTDELSRKKP